MEFFLFSSALKFFVNQSIECLNPKELIKVDFSQLVVLVFLSMLSGYYVFMICIIMSAAMTIHMDHLKLLSIRNINIRNTSIIKNTNIKNISAKAMIMIILDIHMIIMITINMK